MTGSPLRWEERAEEWLQRPLGRFLDYGCGPGRFLEMVHGRCTEVHGVDVDAESVASAKLRLPSADLQVIPHDGRTGFPNDHFDTIALLEVIEHVPDEAATLAEIARILKPGGTLLLTTPHRGLLTFLDVGNLKFLFPRLHRWVHRSVLRGGDEYERRFERVAERGLVGDISTVGQRRPWHRHYRRRDIVRCCPAELALVDSAVYFPGMRALGLMRVALRVITRGRVRELPRSLARLEYRLSLRQSDRGDQLVMRFVKRAAIIKRSREPGACA